MEQTLHCSNASLEYLHRYFLGDRLISRRTDHPCPAHSPDLSPVGYLMRRYLKDRVSASNLQTTGVLKNNIRTGIRRIPHEMLDRIITNFRMRVAAVIQCQRA